MAPSLEFPNELEVRIDTPLGGHVKRRDDGRSLAPSTTAARTIRKRRTAIVKT
jgi:hypothetical protein